jgi:hypothetical protein
MYVEAKQTVSEVKDANRQVHERNTEEAQYEDTDGGIHVVGGDRFYGFR